MVCLYLKWLNSDLILILIRCCSYNTLTCPCRNSRSSTRLLGTLNQNKDNVSTHQVPLLNTLRSSQTRHPISLISSLVWWWGNTCRNGGEDEGRSHWWRSLLPYLEEKKDKWIMLLATTIDFNCIPLTVYFYFRGKHCPATFIWRRNFTGYFADSDFTQIWCIIVY